MEKARNDQSAQLEQMSLVISKLRKRGLPEAHDDSYYSSAFGDLVADLRRWARLAARGHGPIQGDEIQRLSIATQKLLRSRIFNLEQLIHMGNVSRLRTRVMEVILCSRLVEGPLGGSAQLRMGLSQYQGPLFEFAKHMKFDTGK